MLTTKIYNDIFARKIKMTLFAIFQVLILANGAYGKRMMKICDFCDISYDANVTSETRPVPLSEAKQWFAGNHKYE